ncbi:ATP-binding protein [Rhodopila sp.]|uniref:ATP-binding protein n=1 Tax=Rhodopila sp. TaxID=2480087 RepID=UPI002C4F0A30|nr:ATP-binding protein [Rhodopila sp.]HVZ09247.1 ATP-binding protein [Rhodopila sp.]
MSSHPPVAALRVANEAFLVSSTIERCPKTMMIRELVVNAIEAAETAASDKYVDIMSAAIEGVRKLCIRNTGRGMSAQELDRICDLASSLYKENSLDANFGMGAKVASLPSNKHGLRYRSCKDGVVSEVIMCQRDGVYGRLRRGDNPDGTGIDVIDATGICQAEGGYDLTRDWTEVVLYGQSAAQDTVADPYAGNPRMEPDWLLSILLLRFFRLAPDVAVRLSPTIIGGGAPRPLMTLSGMESLAERTEVVETPSGIRIHYRYDPQAGDSPRAAIGIGHPAALGAIVYKNEIYDPRTDKAWVLDAPIYGIPFGAKFCSVFVELPDDYLVRPEAYRQFLRFRGGDQRQVFLHDFGQLVMTYLPAWLKDVIRSHGPQQEKFVGEVEDELRRLVAELEIAPEYKPPPPAAPKADVAKPDGQQPRKPDIETAKPQLQSEAKPPAPPPAPPKKNFERPPEIISLEDEALIEERGLKGRAAKFYPTSHQLFVNLRYPAVTAIAEQLEAEFEGALNPERMRSVAKTVAGWAITRRVARALVYSLSKKAAGWPAEDVRRAQSPESFSLVADDWSSMVEPSRLRMREELGADWQPAETAAELGIGLAAGFSQAA